MTSLHGKYAVVFGAAGSIGAAVAKEFAREGAEVFLAGRTRAKTNPSRAPNPPSETNPTRSEM